MIVQIKGVWVMVAAKAKLSVAKRVAAKLERHECLVPDCTEQMVSCGLCRTHYDCAEHVINSQDTSEAKARARERLIRDGLMLAAWTQPRPKRANSKAAVFQRAVAS